MSNSKHTPGPWIASYDGDDSDKIEVCIEVPDGLAWICADVATVADATLIAAAPVMLAALESINAYLLTVVTTLVTEEAAPAYWAAKDIVHNAITKATNVKEISSMEGDSNG